MTTLTKLAIVLVTFIFIVRAFDQKHAAEQWYILRHTLAGERGVFTLLVIVVMMAVNWSLEALKWQWSLRKIAPVSFIQALKSVLAGLNVAAYTPARIGEYGGRVLHIAKGQRFRAGLAMLVGNISLLVVTLLAGVLGLIYFFLHIHPVPRTSAVWLVSGLSVLALAIPLGFIYSGDLERMLSGSLLKKLKTKVFGFFSTSELLAFLIFSLMRYLIFANQYLVLIKVGEGFPYWASFAMVSLILMVTSIVPSYTLLDVGIRGATATFFFGFLCGKSCFLYVLAVSFAIWVINIILPAVAGSFFVLKKHAL